MRGQLRFSRGVVQIESDNQFKSIQTQAQNTHNTTNPSDQPKTTMRFFFPWSLFFFRTNVRFCRKFPTRTEIFQSQRPSARESRLGSPVLSVLEITSCPYAHSHFTCLVLQQNPRCLLVLLLRSPCCVWLVPLPTTCQKATQHTSAPRHVPLVGFRFHLPWVSTWDCQFHVTIGGCPWRSCLASRLLN
jgi:hypothetical protein